ncbi:E3 ubiquitin-protein ligase Rnf220 [Bicyclus anynana]|uniref:E3 ubiquitin-protein ligase Rnf220 n=1 Tax=Bicyclus anynana TaxID=110368 RepID=A0A6J1NCR0_BICAN|nr:E3 ubiquitin-protein ligase Rnf220 [Bicyclus anynana]
MLPIVMYNMEGSSNFQPNSSLYDESVILNCVRNRKKVSELPNCPVCSCTVRQGELESHLSLEIERLNKLSTGGSKRKLSANSPGPSTSNQVPGSSASTSISEMLDAEDVDVTGCFGSGVYQRVHANRLKRLRARRRSSPPPQATQGECPICNATLPVSRLQRHALRCLKRTGAEMDNDVPDTSSEEGSIDVENDEPRGFGAEYDWCGARVRAAALQDSDLRAGTWVRRASTDHALVVDGDEDTLLFGPPQYSPSRIAPDAEISMDTQSDEAERDTHHEVDKCDEKPNGLVEASAETRIQALKSKIKDMERKQNSSLEAKCLICLCQYTSPTVSIQCWHVYCEVCWLQSLRAKKICPQCNAITTAAHLRRIYM